jgi:phosphoribosylanthranilate isomerase
VAVEVKFCGLTQPADADYAATLGAAYVGAVFAESPRRVSPEAASDVFAPARGRAKTVGVFGPARAEAVATIAHDVSLDAIQLHGDPSPNVVERVRSLFAGEVWAVVRVAGDSILPEGLALFDIADAVVLDTRVPGRLGGTGTPFDWGRVARSLDRSRAHARVVLAGGLTPANVADAVRVLAPDVVDVSSGVEIAPGIKDHARMRAFSEAIRGRGEANE